MDTKTTDRLGRATFHHITPQSNVRPTEREIRWLKHIDRHGPQSSQYLFELTSDTHSCRDTALRQLQKLRAGGYLKLPPQQRETEHAEFKPYVYDLTKKATEHLCALSLNEPNVRPTGHWWHSYTISCVTSAIDIAAGRHGVRFIPAHEILARKGSNLAIPNGRDKLIPDQLFALDYGGSFRAFALEVDRGTEPKTSSAQRKSWARSIEQYDQVIQRKLHRTHYGLKANLIVLWVFTNRSKEMKFRNLLRERPRAVNALFLSTGVPITSERLQSNSLWAHLYEEPWNRLDAEPVLISTG